ncbi:MAG: surface carbohydrate biosynthesis protein [Verrucomicrobiota bacterium]|jgi:surface carbohydrate biosynthesis protein
MKSSAQQRRGIVLLVDSRTRDLAVATLIAHHLEALGVDCHLEPLEAYRAVLGAYRPDMIVFNHLTAGHLVSYSKRLAQIGVLTAVLSNEGINYDPEDLKFNSGKHHPDAHIDWFFCWNEPHRQALMELGFNRRTRIEVIGVPRFDYYIEPWSRIFYQPSRRPRTRPRVLVCTNFSVAKFFELPREEGAKLFAAWKDRIPIYKDYWKAIEDHHKASRRVFDYLQAIVDSDKFDITLRPHPRESVEIYAGWVANLPPQMRQCVTVDSTSNITALILGCDLEISCETCTTAMESWIAGKPTIELLFERNPMFYHPEHAVCSTACDAPEKLVALMDQVLVAESPAILAARQAHLRKWCNAPDGNSCQRLATLIASAVKSQPKADWSKLNATDWRRATKLKLMRNLGLAYHFDPLMPVKLRLNRGRYAIKNHAYEKSIKPRDVIEARLQLEKALNSPTTTT